MKKEDCSIKKNESITRYTTPIQEFTFHEDPNLNFNKIVIFYAQSGNIILRKEKSDLSINKIDKNLYIASFKMTQEESSNFKSGVPVIIQVRVLTYDENVLISDDFECSVNDVLGEELL